MTPGAAFDSLRNAYLLSAGVMAALCLAMILAWRELEGTAALGRFAAGMALMVASTGLLATWGNAPDFLSIVVANVILMVGATVLLEGSREFAGWAPRRAATVATAVVSGVLFFAFTYLRPSVAARVVVSSLILAALLGAAAWTLWSSGRQRSTGPLSLWAAAALGADSVMLTVRAAFALSPGDGAFEALTILALAVGLASGVCWTVAVVLIASRRLRNELRGQKELFAKLVAVARAGATGPTLDSTLADVLEAARGLTGATGSSLFLVDEAGDVMRGILTRGAAAIVVEPSVARRLMAEGLAGWVARNREAALVANVSADPRWCPLSSQNDVAGVRSALSVPIASGTALVGVLTLVHEKTGWFRPDQSRLIDSAGAQIALVLRNAQITDDRMRGARQQTLLNDVLAAAARQLDVDQIATAASDAIRRTTPWTNVVLAVPDDEGSLRLLGGTPALSAVRQPMGRGIIGRAYATGGTQLVPDVNDDPDYFPYTAHVRSELAVPLKHGNRVLGVLNLESSVKDGFAAEDVRMAEALAGALALGLENTRLSEMREDLARALVHDLRSPLVSIAGSLKLLERAQGLTEGDRKLVEVAGRNGQRMAALIDAILEVSRLESGLVPIAPARLSLPEVVSEALRLAGPRAAERDVKLASELLMEGTGEAWADRGLVARVLGNLIDNAIKFSVPGGIVGVTVDQDGNGLLLRVTDHGPGLDAKARQSLFQRFGSGQHRASGSGLGLAFSRLAVEVNGGRIWLEETPGGGATFALTLPAAGQAIPGSAGE
jgi:signal transduction histidine kinase